MSWFNFYTTSGLTTSVTPPIRRLIVFPSCSDNLKTGDWIHAPLEDLNIGQVFYYEDNIIKQTFDQDSFLVVYETPTDKTPTYSYIDENNNLYFKSLTNVNAGSRPDGAYYIYYHCDNIQYIQLSGSNYIRTVNPTGSNYIGSTTGTGNNFVDYYSHIIYVGSSNTRVSQITYLGDPGIWSNGATQTPGAKVLGNFDGPKLKIYGTKGPDKGKINIKIIKTSTTTSGQSVVYSQNGIDLYNTNAVTDTPIFTIDLHTQNSVTNLVSYDDYYGSFSYEIEILQSKNQASSATGFAISKHMYSKNYYLSFNKEEIESTISFTSTGVIR
ncbi:MAG: hypothetical protein RLZZ196_784 [Bacteroidota bacterium]|jgi:hypothetical protein